jgi:hypothetical protein
VPATGVIAIDLPMTGGTAGGTGAAARAAVVVRPGAVPDGPGVVPDCAPAFDGGYGCVVVVCGACCWAAAVAVDWVFGPFLQSAVVKPLRQVVSARQRLR